MSCFPRATKLMSGRIQPCLSRSCVHLALHNNTKPEKNVNTRTKKYGHFILLTVLQKQFLLQSDCMQNSEASHVGKTSVILILGYK